MKPKTERFSGGANYLALLENIQTGVTLIGPDFRVRMANLAQAAFFNKDPRDFIGRLCHEAFEKRKKVCPHCPGVKAMSTGQPCEASTEGVRDDGSKFPVRIKAFPVRDAAGKVDGFIEMVEDMSLRELAEEELGLKNALLRAQMEVSPDGILVVDSRGRMVSFNKKFVEMWGIPDKVAQSRSDEDALRSVLDKLVDPKGFLARVRHLYKHPRKPSREEIRLKDGRVFDRRSEPMFGPDGTHYGRSWFFRDISDRKQAEASLKESEERFRVLAASARDAIIVMDNFGLISYWNPAATRMFGYALKEVLGRPLHTTLVTASHRAAYRKAFPAWQKHGAASLADKTSEVLARKKDGTEFPIELSLSSLRLGGRWHAVGISRDITQRKRRDAQRELLLSLSTVFREQATPEAACQKVCAVLMSKLGVPVAAIFQPEGDGAMIRILGFRGPGTKFRPGVRWPSRDTVSGLVLKTDKAVVEKDCRSRKERQFRYVRRLGLRSFLCVPIRSEGRIIATISIGSAAARDDIEELAETLAAVGGAVGAELQRKRSEISLRESEEKFRLSFEHAKDAILWGDAETGIIVNCNEAAARLFGRPRKQLIGLHQTSLHPPGLKDDYKEHFRQHAKAGSAQDDSAEIITAAGRIVPVGISAQVVNLGGRDVVQGIFRDLSALTQANAERDLLLAVSRIFRDQPSIETACGQISAEVSKKLGVTGCAIMQPAGDGKTIRVLGISSQTKQYPAGRFVPADRTLTSMVLRSGKEVVVPDCRSRKEPAFSDARRLGLRSLLCIPVRSGKDILATVGVGDRTVRADLDRLAETLKGVCSSIAAELRRKTAEQSLKESEERYRRIVETSVEGIGVLDRGLVITFANDRFCSMLAYGPKGLVGRHLRELFFPEDWKSTLKRMAARKRGENEFYESRFKRRDGGECWFQVSGAPVLDGQGRFAGAFAMFTDITARRKAESELTKSRQLYQALAEGIPDFVFMLDTKGRVLYANRKTPQMPEPVGRTQHELFPRKTARKHLSVIRRVVRTGKPSLREEVVTWPGGRSVFENRLIPLKGPDGRIYRLLGLTRDITARKKAEESLRQSEERYRRVIETSQEGFGAIDPGGTITSVSSYLEHMFGYGPGEMKGLSILRDLVLPEDRPSLLAQIRARKRGKPTVYEQRFRRKDGSTFWANVSGTPVKDATGDVTGSFAMMSDITERKLAQEALQESELRFRRIVEGLREAHFFYMHDTKGVFTYLSPSIEQVLGYTKAEFLTHYSTYLTDHPANEAAVQHTNLGIRGIKQPPYLVEIHHKDKTRHWLRVIETPVRDLDGRVIGVEGLAEDITRRKEMEESLRESEQRFKALIESSGVAIAVMRDAKFLLANKAFAELYGFRSPDEVAGRSIFSLVAPSQVKVMRKQHEARVSGKPAPRQFEGMAQRRDGSLFPVFVQINAIRLPDGDAMVGYFTDITPRKRAQEALKSSEHRLRTLFRLSSDAIFIHRVGSVGESRGTIVEANDAAVQRLGYSLQELRLMSPKDFDDPKCPTDMPAVFAQLRKKGHAIFEQVHMAKDGRRIPVEISAQYFELEGRKMVFSIARDISERKRVESELQKLRTAVSSSQETERRRLSRELHDGVGQILSGIKFSLQALPEDVASAPWDASKNILKAAGLLDKAIAEVRRVSQDLMPSELVDLGLQPALMALCREFKERSGVKAQVQLDILSRNMGRDASLALYRIAQEALANVERHAKASAVDLSLRRRKNMLELTVADDGRGCSARHRRRRTAEGGLGLGNISDRVNALGGRMEFDSKQGKGTRLTVAVPLGNGRSKGS
ncbi:MAG: PAS domain S-box protein [Elusimicrobia bacterium]|nr:PAS domain S-box protein [Elusimicrobiota bacterium]